jgi:hypothetical protein
MVIHKFCWEYGAEAVAVEEVVAKEVTAVPIGT